MSEDIDNLWRSVLTRTTTNGDLAVVGALVFAMMQRLSETDERAVLSSALQRLDAARTR